MSNSSPKNFTLLLLLFVIIVITALSTKAAVAYEIVDNQQQTVTFSKPFHRIISLYPAHTENLVYLGASRQLIGIGTSDTYPESITALKRFSYRDNAEKFLAAKPDLILIRPMIARFQPELIAKLRDSGIIVISLQPTNVDEMFEYWRILGKLTGSEKKAAIMIAEFSEKVHQFTLQLPQDIQQRPRVYFESMHSKMKTFAPSAISMFALTSAGGVNIAADAKGRNNSNIAPYGKEKILSQADSIDVFLSQVGRMNRIMIDDILNEPGFTLIKAVQTRSVFLIEEELVSRPTMRLLEGIKKIHNFLYPVSLTTPERVTQLPISDHYQP